MRAPTSRAEKLSCAAIRASHRVKSGCSPPAASPRSRCCAGQESPCSRPATSLRRRETRSAPHGYTTATGRSSRLPSLKLVGKRCPPGFPTSAIFTFHAFVAPAIRARTGLTQATHNIEAAVPVRIASELGRKEFVLVALTAGEGGPVAFPTAKGSGAVTSFSQADGFLEIDALAGALDAGSRARGTLIGGRGRRPRPARQG